MKKTIKMVLISLLLCSLVSGCNFIGNNDNSSSGIIQGTVKIPMFSYGGNLSLGRALVSIKGENIQKKFYTEKGSFEFSNLNPGTYILNVHKLGYNQFSTEINLKENEQKNVEIDLNSKKDYSYHDGIYYYGFNINKAPFDDVVVRKALSLAAGISEIINNLSYEHQGKANRIISPLVKGYKEENLTYPFDLNKAENLLNNNGYSTGELNFTLYYNETDGRHNMIASKLKEDWEQLNQVGTVDLQGISSFNEYEEGISNGEYGVYRMGWRMDTNDPIDFLKDLSRSEYKEVEELLAEAAKKSNKTEEALPFIYQTEEKILEKALLLPIYYYKQQKIE